MTQLKMWQEWEKKWDEGAEVARREHPNKDLKRLPNMPGVTPDTAKGLRWKALKYMIRHDEGFRVMKLVLQHPFRYAIGYAKSLLRKQSFKRDGDFFLYNTASIDAFRKKLHQKNNVLIVGFSYCHKPFECPSGRFTDQCIADPENPACRQCFIGKTVNALPTKNIKPLFIPTVHYISEKMLEITHEHPGQDVLFIITACEMTLKMFADWGNMANIQGVGVRLDGRICNTMRAFELSEEGIKPGLTVVLPETQARILDLIRERKTAESM